MKNSKLAKKLNFAWAVSLALSALLTSAAFARSGESSGGGDETGLEFKSTAIHSLAQLKKEMPAVYGPLAKKHLETIVEQLNVIVVDSELHLPVKGDVQNSAAINEPSSRTVLVNRARWTLMSSAVKEGIALHEVLSIAGIESTGYYPISSQYLEKRGEYSSFATEEMLSEYWKTLITLSSVYSGPTDVISIGAAKLVSCFPKAEPKSRVLAYTQMRRYVGAFERQDLNLAPVISALACKKGERTEQQMYQLFLNAFQAVLTTGQVQDEFSQFQAAAELVL